MNEFLVLDCTARPESVVIEYHTLSGHIGSAVVFFDAHRSQQLLAEVETLLQSLGRSLIQLGGIAVIHGADRFTVARLCVVTANALAFALGVPVRSYAQRPSLEMMVQDCMQSSHDSFVIPRYTKEPIVT